jgi:exopolyphosphatase/guanosine-5'-triphosphate,3'-diphosphate pyrophosphatase
MNPDLIRHETGILLVRHETEPEHTLHVARLAGQLFDGLSARHGLPESDRLLLDCAAALHDIGWAVTQPDGRAHHKASARMIREFQWTSLDREEVRLVAVVARYHRKSLPTEDHGEFVSLSADDRRRMLWLAGCLRLADGDDRRHLQCVGEVVVSLAGDGVELTVRSPREIGEELMAARKKSDLLQQVLGCPVRLVRGGTD